MKITIVGEVIAVQGQDDNGWCKLWFTDRDTIHWVATRAKPASVGAVVRLDNCLFVREETNITGGTRKQTVFWSAKHLEVIREPDEVVTLPGDTRLD